MSMKECGDCGYVGKPSHDEYSSVLIDVFAWGFGLITAFITANIYLVIIGPVVTLWHLLTFHSHRCPKCGNWEMRSQGSALGAHRVRNHGLGHR